MKMCGGQYPQSSNPMSQSKSLFPSVQRSCLTVCNRLKKVGETTQLLSLWNLSAQVYKVTIRDHGFLRPRTISICSVSLMSWSWKYGFSISHAEEKKQPCAAMTSCGVIWLQEWAGCFFADISTAILPSLSPFLKILWYYGSSCQKIILNAHQTWKWAWWESWWWAFRSKGS